MSVHANESNGYFSIADHTSLTLASTGWVVGVCIQSMTNAGSLYKYIASNNNLAATNSFNMLLTEKSEATNPDKVQLNIKDNSGGVFNMVANTAYVHGQFEYYFAQLDTVAGEVQLWRAPFNSVATKVASVSSSGIDDINGGLWNLLRRVDGDASRYFGGYFQWFFKGSAPLTQEEMDTIALGTLPTEPTLGLSLDTFLHFVTSSATISDDVGSNDATRQGTVYNGFSPGGNECNVFDVGDNNDIASAINAGLGNGVKGDKLIFPAGKYKLDSNIFVGAEVQLIGQGNGHSGTQLYRSVDTSDGAYMFRWDMNTTANTDIVVKDIWFAGAEPSTYSGDPGSTSDDYCLQIYRSPRFRVTGCRFDWFGHAAIEVKQINNNYRGLVDKCLFWQCVKYNAAEERKTTTGYGVVCYEVNGYYPSQGNSPAFGTVNSLYVEDCTFIRVRHAISSTFGSIYCFRHNLVLDCFYAMAMDAHGPGFGSSVGSVLSEIYGNRVVNTSYINNGRAYSNFYKNGPETSENTNTPYIAQKIRGGANLTYDNVYIGYRHAIETDMDTGSTVGGYPYLQAVGYNSRLSSGSGHSGSDTAAKREDDLFYWDNSHSIETGANGAEFLNGWGPPYYISGRDYHNVDYSAIVDDTEPIYTPYTYPHPQRAYTIPSGQVVSTDPRIKGLWLFEDDLTDESGEGNTLTDNGTIVYSADSQEGSKSADFELADGDYLSRAHNSGLNGSSMSIAAWVKFESVGADRVIAAMYDYGSNDRSYALRLDGDGNINFTFSDDGTDIEEIVFRPTSAATWKHFVATFDEDSGLAMLYTDGQPVAAIMSDFTTIYQNTVDFTVGAMLNSGADANNMDGLVDELLIADGVLTQEEVMNIYNNGVQIVPTAGNTFIPEAIGINPIEGLV